MSTHPYAQLARDVYGRFGRNDFQGVLELVTDDIEATIIPFGQTFKGLAIWQERSYLTSRLVLFCRQRRSTLCAEPLNGR
jgi:hypothetical protein